MNSADASNTDFNNLQRFLLAEVIKASNVPLDTLLSIVKTEGVLANWEEVCLPPSKFAPDPRTNH